MDAGRFVKIKKGQKQAKERQEREAQCENNAVKDEKAGCLKSKECDER